MKTLAYCRVSSLGQAEHGQSLEAQQADVARYCARHGLPEPRYFVEAESGGGTGERRAKQLELMAAAERGDVVIVARQDRWSRDTIHTLASLRDLQKRGVYVVSLSERVDLSTPGGNLQATMSAAFAEYERLVIRERSMRGKAALREKGCVVDRLPPLGYSIVDKHLVKNDTTAPALVQAFELAIEHPLCRVSEMLTRRYPWIRGVSGSHLAGITRDRRYLGLSPRVPLYVAANDSTIPWVPSHEPLVTQDLFDAVERGRAWQRAQRIEAQRARLTGRVGRITRKNADSEKNVA